MDDILEAIGTNAALLSLTVITLIGFFKREIKKFDSFVKSEEQFREDFNAKFSEKLEAFEDKLLNKISSLSDKLAGIHDRVLRVEFEIPNLKDLEKTILSVNEGKALWKRIDEIKEDISRIREREHDLANAITKIKGVYELPKWEKTP
jgi:predicted  nucleic acid-binding Zn-ribbon protein